MFCGFCNKTVRRWTRRIIFALLLFTAAVTFCSLIALTARAATDGILFINQQAFPFYKNTMYGSCASVQPRQCVPADLDFQKLSYIQGGDNQVGYIDSGFPLDSYCACFNGWQVIPSQPRDSAYSLSWLATWISQTETLIMVLWTYLMFKKSGDQGGQNNSNSDDKTDAKPSIRSRYKYLINLFDISSFISWWISFGKLAKNPASAFRITLLAWITPYRKIFELSQYQNATLIFTVLTLAQYAATIAALALMHGFNLFSPPKADAEFVRYDPVLSQYTGSISSSCSVEQIEGLTGLYTSPILKSPTYSGAEIGHIISFVLLSLTIIVFLGCRFIGSDNADRDTIRRRVLLTVVIGLGIGDYINIGTSLNPARYGSNWAVSTITFHEACKVIHISMSPFRGYYDVNENSKPWRIAKAFLNA